jgi:methionyl-tRNA formyltransferase
MLPRRPTPIDENEDIVSLHDRMSVMGAELLAETLDGLRDGRIVPVAQDDSLTCYAPMLRKEDGLIDWQRPARQIHNQVRGLAAWPGAQTFLNGQALKLFRTRVADGAGVPGTVLCSTGGMLEVACLDGSLLIQELQLAGKKRLDSASFLAGCPIAEGTLLGGAVTESPIP